MAERGRGRGVAASVGRGVADGGGYLYRPGEVLVDERAVDAVVSRLRKLRAAREVAELHHGLGLVRLTLAGDEASGPVPEIVRELRAAGLPVSPNHVLQDASHMNIRPANAPEPAEAMDLSDGPIGNGVSVGIIDSGVWIQHPWLAGHTLCRNDDREADSAGAPFEVEVLDDGTRRLRHYAGHGTFIAGVIRQHAPGATMVVRRVLRRNALISDSELAERMLELADVDVLNLSLGTHVDSDIDDPEARALLATANSLIALAHRNPNLVVVAPAGNDGESGEVWPAAFETVISVAALDRNGEEGAGFSNFGSWVTASARGEDVESSFLVWDGELEPPKEHVHQEEGPDADHDAGAAGTVQRGCFNGWAKWSGTSFATPRVAAAIAAKLSGSHQPPMSMGLGLGMGKDMSVEAVLSEGRSIPGFGRAVEPATFARPAPIRIP